MCHQTYSVEKVLNLILNIHSSFNIHEEGSKPGWDKNLSEGISRVGAGVVLRKDKLVKKGA